MIDVSVSAGSLCLSFGGVLFPACLEGFIPPCLEGFIPHVWRVFYSPRLDLRFRRKTIRSPSSECSVARMIELVHNTGFSKLEGDGCVGECRRRFVCDLEGFIPRVWRVLFPMLGGFYSPRLDLRFGGKTI